MEGNRKPTATSSFGVSRREAHDSSDFYARFSAPIISDDDTVNSYRIADELWCVDAREMDDEHERIRPNSVALVVTSPPYFAGKDYELELGEGHIPGSYVDYLEMLHDVFAKCVDKLEPGGRIAVNVANLGRKPYRSLSSDIVSILQDRLGLLLRGEVLWQKAMGATGSCAWGSFQSASNPVLRDLTERVIIASKGRFDRAIPRAKRAQLGLPHADTLTKDEFMAATLDLWQIPAESATRVGHPAPFPVELPRRLIELYTYEDDLVLDPFMGAGSTAVAALRTGRHYVGFDTDRTYLQMAKDRIASERTALGASRRATVRLAGVRVKATDASSERTTGGKAVDLAASLLVEAGFTDLATPSPPHGAEIDFRVTAPNGSTWYVFVAGGFSSPRLGLNRPDVFWKIYGQSAALHTGLARNGDSASVLVLTTELPAKPAVRRLLQSAIPSVFSAALDLTDPHISTSLTALLAGSATPRST